MPRKGENIRKRRDGRWEARVRYTNSAGQLRCTSLYAKSYKEVKEKKKIFQLEIFDSISDDNSILFGKVMDEWISNNLFRQKDATKLKYQVIIDNHIRPKFGPIEIQEIDESMINHFLVDKLTSGRLDKKGGLSCSYVKIMGVILNSIFEYAVSKNYCKPLKGKINSPVSERKEIDVMSIDEQKLLEAKLQYDHSLISVGIAIALNAGLRIGEICALCWADIDLENRVIHVKHTVARVKASEEISDTSTKLIIDKPKTKTSARDIPITTKLLSILKRARGNAVSSYVISDKATFLSPRTFEYQFHRLLHFYGIPDMNFHSLRHTFATRCVEMGVDTKTLSEILGHANVSTTLNIYVHPSLELKRIQLEKLSGLH